MRNRILHPLAALVVFGAVAGCDDEPSKPNPDVADSLDTTQDTNAQSDTEVADTEVADTEVADAELLDTDLSDTDADTTLVAPPPVITTTLYHTADQMLLANEINESGEPFAEALGYNLDELDPAVPGSPDDISYSLGIENYEYSRYQLGTVISRSGIGLHMMWAPMIMQMAAMEPADFDGSMTMAPNGYNEDDELMRNIMMFSTLTGQAPPGNPWPQFAEFVSGDPHLPQAIDAAQFNWADFSTLRWDRSKMTKSLNPAALGQTLMKQYLWAQDMLGAFHDSDDNGIDADGTVSPDLAASPEFDPSNNVFYGGSALDGFIGMVLTAEGINKVAFLTGSLAYDGTTLGMIDLMSYDPANGLQYFVHGIDVTEEPVAAGLPPKAGALVVSDPHSDLFDQASLLWAVTSFANMMDPSDTSDAPHLAYKAVFDGSPFPNAMSETGTAGPYDLMMATGRVIFLNLQAMHYDAVNEVFVDTARLDAGTVSRMNRVSIEGSAYLLVALESFIGEFVGTPLEQAATEAVAKQATFVLTHLSDGSGLFYDAVMVGDTTPGTTSLSAQAAAVRALYVAFRVTGDSTFGDAADAAYARLIADYYVQDQALFRTQLGSDTATFTPRNFAILAGALREASLEGGYTEAPTIYTAVWQNVANRMQLSEGAASGETGGDSDGDGIAFIPEQAEQLPPVFATQAVYTLLP